MSDIWIQLIITSGSVVAAMLLTIRFAISQSNKKDKSFLDYLKNQSAQQLEYYESKNGHLERISADFTKTINKNTRAIDKLAVYVKGSTGETGPRGPRGFSGNSK